MKNSKLKRLLSLGCAMAVSLTAMSSAALAADNKIRYTSGSIVKNDGVITATDATAAITKTLQMNEGTTTPAATFTFQFVGSADNATGAPVIADQNVTFAATDTGTTTTGVKTVSLQSTNFVPDGNDFPEAGTYTYTATETADTYTLGTGETMTYSKASYQVKLTVANVVDPDTGAQQYDGEGHALLYVKYVEVWTSLDDNGTEVTTPEKVNPTPGDGNTFTYINKFYKEAGSEGDNKDNLVITKTLAGDAAVFTDTFTFSLTLTAPAMMPATEVPVTTAAYKVYKADGTEDTTRAGTAVYGTAATFTLGHGEKLVFTDLLVGTRYTVTEEANTKDYVPSVVVTENGTAAASVTGTKNTALTVPTTVDTTTVLLGEKDNSSAYTNTKTTTTPTGILMNNLPFVGLIVVGFAALSVLFFTKRRKNEAQ